MEDYLRDESMIVYNYFINHRCSDEECMQCFFESTYQVIKQSKQISGKINYLL